MISNRNLNKKYLFLKITPVYFIFSAIGALMAALPLMYLYHKAVYAREPMSIAHVALLMVPVVVGLHWLATALKAMLRW